MSLVGPRPLISDDIAKLKAIDKNSWKRQRMKPGMTGLSQITVDERFGKSKSILKQKITNDIWYSENWCLLVDFKIMFFTLVYIFKQKQILSLIHI